jgi:hypothetical protein
LVQKKSKVDFQANFNLHYYTSLTAIQKFASLMNEIGQFKPETDFFQKIAYSEIFCYKMEKKILSIKFDFFTLHSKKYA